MLLMIFLQVSPDTNITLTSNYLYIFFIHLKLTLVIYIPNGKLVYLLIKFWLNFGFVPSLSQNSIISTQPIFHILQQQKKILVLEKHNFYASQHNMVMKRFFLRKKIDLYRMTHQTCIHF